MYRRVRRSVAFLPVAVVVILLAVSCLGDPSAPRFGSGYLSILPNFVSRAASLVEVSQVRAVLTRPDDGTVALDTVVDVDTQDNTVDLTLKLAITPPEETFTLTLECLNSAGAVVFRGGPIEVTATTASDGIVAEEVRLDYVGPGYDAAAIQIVDPIMTVDFGDTVQLMAEVLDSSGSPLSDTPIAWSSLNTQRATVTSTSFTVGLVAGESQRGPVEIEARTLTDQADTVTIVVEAVPNSVAIVSGDGQTGYTGLQLSASLVVEVKAVDGLGVFDVPVQFATTDGGSFGGTSLRTDSSGQVSTTWILGPTSGTQSATATVTGVGDVTFTATAQSGVVWVSAAGGNWSNGGNWSTGTPPAASDVAVIALDGDYTVNLDTDATIAGLGLGAASGTQSLNISRNSLTLTGPGTVGPNGSFSLAGSTLGGTGILTVEGRFDWTGGTITGTGEVDVGPNGAMYLSGGPKFLRASRVIRVFGGLTWSAGDILAGEGSVLRIEDSGRCSLEADALFDWDTGAQSTVVNVGTVTRYVGTGAVTFTSRFNNFGTLDIRTGTVSLRGANHIITDTIDIALGAVPDEEPRRAREKRVAAGFQFLDRRAALFGGRQEHPVGAPFHETIDGGRRLRADHHHPLQVQTDR